MNELLDKLWIVDRFRNFQTVDPKRCLEITEQVPKQSKLFVFKIKETSGNPT